MKYLIFIFLLVQFPTFGNVTPQVLDVLILNSDTMFLYKSPFLVKKDLLKKDTNFINNTILTTASRRGYVATWHIQGDELFLMKISSSLNKDSEADLTKLFPNQKTKIKAKWVSETLVARSKFEVFGYRIGFSRVYEEELVLTIRNGNLISIKELSNLDAKPPNDTTTKLNEYVSRKLPTTIKRQIWKKHQEYDFFIVVVFGSNKEILSLEYAVSDKEISIDKEQIEKIVYKFDKWQFVYKNGKEMNEYAIRLKINPQTVKKHKSCW